MKGADFFPAATIGNLRAISILAAYVRSISGARKFLFLGPRYSDARRSPDLVLGRSGRRMHKVGVAIDARHATLLQRCVRGATILTFRTYRVGVMTAAAGDTVPPAHPGLSFLRQLHSVSRPNLRIFEIVREFGKNVARARGRLDVGLHKPVCFRNVAVTAAR